MAKNTTTIKELKIGQAVEELIASSVDNFDALNESKEPAFTHKSAFNKDFFESTPAMDGVATDGTSNTVARGDHRHPTDTSRLAVTPDSSKGALLDGNNKINVAYLPDSIVGQLEYKGTFDASGASDPATGSPEHGWYYICNKAGYYNPEGHVGFDDYAVGDWAVYNGDTSNWDKVDNTDAVTMVNGKTGSIETYLGEHNIALQYKKSDMVSDANGRIYVCKANIDTVNTIAITNKDYWLPTGSVMDVTVNGLSAVNSDGVAVISIDEIEGIFETQTIAGETINGITYYGFYIQETDTAFEVYKDSKQIITQNIRNNNKIFIACGTAGGETVAVRKLNGGAVNVGSKIYHHHILLANTGDAPTYYIRFDVYNSYPDIMRSVSLLQTYASGLYSVSGVYSSDKATQKPVSYIKIDVNGVSMYGWTTSSSGVGQTTPTNLGDGFGITDTVTAL